MITEAKKKMWKISKELKTLSNKYKAEGHPNYHNQARKDINLKYGKFWRDKLVLEDFNTNPNAKAPKMSYH